MRLLARFGHAARMIACFAVLATAIEAHASNGSVDTASASTPSPAPVASGQMATSSLGATATAPTSSNYVTYTGPTWSWSVTGASPLNIVQPDNTKSAATLQATVQSPGTYTITATATATWQGSDGTKVTASRAASPVTLVVVGVSAIQYLDPVNGYVNTPATLYVLVGQSVTFKAISTPAVRPFQMAIRSGAELPEPAAPIKS